MVGHIETTATGKGQIASMGNNGLPLEPAQRLRRSAREAEYGKFESSTTAS